MFNLLEVTFPYGSPSEKFTYIPISLLGGTSLYVGPSEKFIYLTIGLFGGTSLYVGPSEKFTWPPKYSHRQALVRRRYVNPCLTI